MGKSEFVYVTYIKTTPEKVWDALTSSESIQKYWFGMRCQSDFKTGSSWWMILSDGRVADSGEIIESDPPVRLVIKWRNEFRTQMKAEGYSSCVFAIDPSDDVVKLTVRHSIDASPSKFIEAVADGWPKVLSNLKSLLETG